LKKIVIIENDEDILDIVGLVLTVKGFDVLPSQTSIPIEKIITDNPNLILLDYYLDDGYGKEICLEVKSNPLTRHIPVVIFSAMVGLEQAAKDSCADAFIGKPFNIEDLKKLVTDLAI
jgi:two-component system phosphate regulon response regulator PhoB